MLEAFRRGEFDQIEIIGQADEKEFFELCFRERILQSLAQNMPTAREKEEVPRWFVLAANLSLKLHLENSFLALERVIQCGGLLGALDPAIASKHLDPESKEILIQCQGFNDKNHYDRKTPCDQDFLRKFAKDVPAQSWMDWFNGPVQKVFQSHGFFDPEGIFIGDGSYLFVPNNPNYEGSVLMWFDEHNHPVDYEKLTPEQRKTAHLERCYKLVSLLHWRQGCFVYAAMEVVPGNAHESPVLYRLVADFVAAVGPGVMKKLLLDRGFIDGANISHCKKKHNIDVIIPMKKNMDIWTDAWALSRTERWQEIPRPVQPVSEPPPDRPEPIVRRESKRQETLARKKAEAPAPDPSELLQKQEFCALANFTSWDAATVPIHALLIRETYADGHQFEWALMTTREFADPLQPKEDYRLRTDIEERHRILKCFYDLTGFRSTCFNLIASQVVFILLSYTLRQYQLWRQDEEELAGKTPGSIERGLNIRREEVVIYHQKAYTRMPLVTFARELLQLTEEAKAKALAKIRKLEESLLAPMGNVRAPP